MRYVPPLWCLFWALQVAIQAFAADPGTAPGSAAAAQRPKHRLVLCNDGGTLGAPDMEAPIGVEGLIKETIDPLRDTMVDTLYWQLGTDPYWGTTSAHLSDQYSHQTKVAPRWGQGRDKFKTAGEWRIYENTRHIMEQGADPPAVVIDAGHRAGLDVFLSVRVNDTHDSRLPLDDVNMSPTKREHPEWLLHYDGWQRTGYNFALPEVRDYRFALIDEAIRQYDLDGFNVDFSRYPTLFDKGEGEKNAALITEWMQRIRAALDAKSKLCGRPLPLSIRVPALSADETRRYGIDVARWIQAGLVDVVILGETRGWHYRLPIEEYRVYAAGTSCKILAQNLCAYKEDRGRSASVLFGERNYYSTEQFRATAARHWQAGADGIFIWNQHFLKFDSDDRFDRQSWKEIGDPQALARKDKHYLVGPKQRGGVLPLDLAKPGDVAEINVEIADDIVAARTDAALREATLRLLIEQLTRVDELVLTLNGVRLNRANAVQRLNYNDCWLDFDVATLLAKGNNRLQLELVTRNPHVEAPLKIRSVEALVRYNAP
jgi:hypothetical protein